MLSIDLKERIVKWYFEDGLTYRDIRDQARVSLGLISNTIRNFQEFDGQVVNPFRQRYGTPWVSKNRSQKSKKRVEELNKLSLSLNEAQRAYL